MAEASRPEKKKEFLKVGSKFSIFTGALAMITEITRLTVFQFF